MDNDVSLPPPLLAGGGGGGGGGNSVRELDVSEVFPLPPPGGAGKVNGGKNGKGMPHKKGKTNCARKKNFRRMLAKASPSFYVKRRAHTCGTVGRVASRSHVVHYMLHVES